uniref:Uncharacterized protein n=1 Tax=Cannabis sativa TaxID=3483 RepID=A0A803QEI7_CANSA
MVALTRDVTIITWEEFQELFNAKLARLALGIVPTDFSKKEKYLDGLNPKIKHDLMITTNDTTTNGDMVGKALRAEGAAECIQESRRTQIVGEANTPTFGYGRGGSDSTTDQKRKVPSGFGGSSQSRRFQGNQGRGNCHSGPEN